MRRRTFLASSTLALTTTAGCLGLGGSGGDQPSDEGDQPSGGEDGYETKAVEGEQVPLVPIEETYDWYEAESAEFVDARGEGQFRDAHIEGAVWSPAPDGREDDPVAAWPKDQRIVCYCGCPHHLSSLRASSLLSEGYDAVYVIDEGFGEWLQQEYPVEGERVGERASARVIHGKSDASLAGEPVYATHEPSDQREANVVGDDGSYELTLRFRDVTDDSEIRLEAPDYTVVDTLAALTSDVVRGQ